MFLSLVVVLVDVGVGVGVVVVFAVVCYRINSSQKLVHVTRRAVTTLNRRDPQEQVEEKDTQHPVAPVV